MEECKECIKNYRLIRRYELLVSKLTKDRDSWASAHWKLVGENVKLRDSERQKKKIL